MSLSQYSPHQLQRMLDTLTKEFIEYYDAGQLYPFYHSIINIVMKIYDLYDLKWKEATYIFEDIVKTKYKRPDIFH